MNDETSQNDGGLDTAEHVSGLLAGYALGVLEADETEQVLRHLAGCPRCRAELEDLQAAAGMLAYAAPVQQVPIRARAAVLTRVAEIGSSNPEQMVVLPPIERAASSGGRWRSRLPQPTWYTLVPAALLLISVSISAILMQSRINDQESQLQTVEQDRGRALDVLAVESTARFVSELTASSVAPGARARLFVDLKANNAMLVAIDLPAPPEGSAYVAWLMIHDEYALVGPLELDEIGRTQLIIDPPDDLDRYESFVVTLEPDPKATEPVGPQIFNGPIHPQGINGEQLGLEP